MLTQTPEQLEHIRLLVQELRTTDKPQARHALVRLDDGIKSYCCLGIATELAMAHGVELDTEEVSDYRVYSAEAPWSKTVTVLRFLGALRDDSSSGVYRAHSCTSLTPEVRDWYGFGVEDPLLTDENGRTKSATQLNDESKYTFKQIADAFERKYLAPSNEDTNDGERDTNDSD